MKANFLYWTVAGGGGHTLLSLIPFLLQMHKLQPSEDVVELDVNVHFEATKLPNIPGFLPEFLPEYNSALPTEPKCSVFKTTKKLKIEYVSQFLPHSTPGEYFVSRDTLSPHETKGCQKLQGFVREFRDVLSKLIPQIKKKSNFDPTPLMLVMDEVLSNFPKTDAELITMTEEQRQLPNAQADETFEPNPFVSKTLPELIPVNHYPDYGASKFMGTYGKAKLIFGKRNQFWARVAAEFSNENRDAPWEERKYWYAILHTFDSKGFHLETKAQKIGTTAEGESRVLEEAKKVMDSFIEALGSVEYGNISIRLFHVLVDGHKFGMLDTSSEEYGEQTSMEPGDLVFYPPWTGDYDT